jgi:hypothetical protein
MLVLVVLDMMLVLIFLGCLILKVYLESLVAVVELDHLMEETLAAVPVDLVAADLDHLKVVTPVVMEHQVVVLVAVVLTVLLIKRALDLEELFLLLTPQNNYKGD